jgi:hypothetical protein
MNLEELKKASLKQCLALGIKTVSKINLPLVKASLARHWRYPVFSVKFGDYTDDYTIAVGLLDRRDYSKYREFLEKINFPWEFLNPWFYLEAIAVYLYENDLPFPEEFCVKPANPLELYRMSDDCYDKISNERNFPELTYKLFVNRLFISYQLVPLLPQSALKELSGGKEGDEAINYLVKIVIPPALLLEKLSKTPFVFRPNLRLVGYKSVKQEEMLKNYKKYDANEILSVLGLINSSEFDIITEQRIIGFIESNENRFWLSQNIRNCDRTTDFYDQKFEDFVIVYGTMKNYKCYSPEELENSFVYDRVTKFSAFRIPDEPQKQFPEEDVVKLLKMLVEQDPMWILNFKEKTDSLVKKIALMTSKEGILEDLSPKDIEIFIVMMKNLFEAGMYQRTWKGPGYGYPMNTRETKGSCQDAINQQMTIPLNNILDEFNNLSKEGRRIVNKKSLIYNAGREELYPDSIMSFVRTTISGNFCVGGGSAMMIETAYYYLNKMNRKIEGFDYNKFQATSTHR